MLNDEKITPLQGALLQDKVDQIEEKRISKEKELLKELEDTLDELEHNLELPWLNLAMQKIQDPNLCRVDTTKYQERLRGLEKKVYINKAALTFIKLKEYGDEFRLKHLQEDAKEAFKHGATNDEIMANLIPDIEELLGHAKSKLESVSKSPDKQELVVSKSERVALWENLLQELKENPIDFRQFLDKETPDDQ